MFLVIYDDLITRYALNAEKDRVLNTMRSSFSLKQ